MSGIDEHGRDYLEHGEGKAEELAKEPVVDKQYKEGERQGEQQLNMIVLDHSCLVLIAVILPE